MNDFACGAQIACANEIDSNPASAKNEKLTQQAGALKCANLHFKHRYREFLVDGDRLMSEQAEQSFFDFT